MSCRGQGIERLRMGQADRLLELVFRYRALDRRFRELLRDQTGESGHAPQAAYEYEARVDGATLDRELAFSALELGLDGVAESLAYTMGPPPSDSEDDASEAEVESSRPTCEEAASAAAPACERAELAALSRRKLELRLFGPDTSDEDEA